MHKLYELKDKLLNELEGNAENGKFSKDDAEAIKALSASVEHIDNICENEDGVSYDDGMSGSYQSDGMGGSYRGYSRQSRSYRGRSYARGRGSNAQRDSMGRYSGTGNMDSIKEEVGRLADKIDQM